MSRVCQVTGKTRMIGNHVSHSRRRVKREFAPNLKTKKFWSEEEKRFITLKVSCNGMKTIYKNGLAATLKRSQEKGLIDIV
ncbi:MAG: 50S ribosomal protein L28 [Bacteroidales bacterium]|nr:50S ribosomal protein L28 [Bacteroidales bacterium]MBP5316180.1 50S ribosomal protein L28 [Bacteroidales bacterium]MBQ4021908.1 50S ribosomal protein L28 [Bacteroidales bacterium]MBR3526926.1 50S ribosomal protein L28 [Bacteroidales bacterium]MCR5827582.1 50S ribosomal protein L28 [Bacteroidales bacterium]